MDKTLPSSIIYSCTYADYDYTLGPIAHTRNANFWRFGTTRPNCKRIWRHKPVPMSLEKDTQTLTNRYFKLFPTKVLADCDVAIYVDGNILIRRDISPIIREFWESGADIALFKHPSGRTLGEEIDFALEHRIPFWDAAVTEEQRAKYADLGLLDSPITENSIIFFRMSSAKLVEIGEIWWDELVDYSKRDQISLPYVLHMVAPKVHIWDWHFHNPSPNNPYFERYGHRRAGVLDRLRDVSHFMKGYSLKYRLVYAALKSGGTVRKLVFRG